MSTRSRRPSSFLKAALRRSISASARSMALIMSSVGSEPKVDGGYEGNGHGHKRRNGENEGETEKRKPLPTLAEAARAPAKGGRWRGRRFGIASNLTIPLLAISNLRPRLPRYARREQVAGAGSHPSLSVSPPLTPFLRL